MPQGALRRSMPQGIGVQVSFPMSISTRLVLHLLVSQFKQCFHNHMIHCTCLLRATVSIASSAETLFQSHEKHEMSLRRPKQSPPFQAFDADVTECRLQDISSQNDATGTLVEICGAL